MVYDWVQPNITVRLLIGDLARKTVTLWTSIKPIADNFFSIYKL